MLNKLRCYAHFQFSANKIAWSRLLIQIHILNDKQCRSRSVGFWRSQLIWIYTVYKDRVYPGSAGLGLRNFATMAIQNRFWSDRWRFWSDEWMHTLIWIFARPKCGKVRFLLLWLIKDCQATKDTKILRCKKQKSWLPTFWWCITDIRIWWPPVQWRQCDLHWWSRTPRYSTRRGRGSNGIFGQRWTGRKIKCEMRGHWRSSDWTAIFRQGMRVWEMDTFVRGQWRWGRAQDYWGADTWSGRADERRQRHHSSHAETQQKQRKH